MEQWSGAQRAFAVKSVYKNNGNLEAARREFRRHFNLCRHDLIPSVHAIKILVSNFEETGSALKRSLPVEDEPSTRQRILPRLELL
jgi:hypothetical protein